MQWKEIVQQIIIIITKMKNRTSFNMYKTRNMYTRSTIVKKQPSSTSKQIYRDHLQKVQSKNYLGPTISATHFYIYDSINDTYFGHKQYQQRQIASLTKIMTTILALELIERYGLDKQLLIKVSKQAAILNGTSAKLKQGCFVKLYDLLYGAMLPSGNDAAFLIAQVFGLLLFYENIKPDQKQYVDIQSIDLSFYQNTVTFVNRYLKQMNKKAKQLKMIKTNFANPHGLVNPLNVSTAKDMMILSKYSIENKDFSQIVSTKQYDCQLYGNDMETVQFVREWKNTNKLIEMGWEGIKTGQTPSAGCCLASVKNGIFIVLLNSATAESRFQDTIQVYNWYLSRNSTSQKFLKETQEDSQQYFKQCQRQK